MPKFEFNQLLKKLWYILQGPGELLLDTIANNFKFPAYVFYLIMLDVLFCIAYLIVFSFSFDSFWFYKICFAY